MDLGKAFSFVFDDENWLTTILIGGLLQLIPIIGQLALIGFMIETAQNVARGVPRPLPTWSDFGGKLSKGFAGFVIQLVYALPVVIILLFFACAAVLTGSTASRSGEEAAAALFGTLGLCLIPLLIIIGLVLQPLVLAAIGRYAQEGTLGAALRFGDVFAMVRGDLGTWVVVWLVNILCGFIAGLGAIAFGIGVLFTTVYGQAVFGHYLGQVLARSRPVESYTGYPG